MENKINIELIIFDMDGLMFDTEKLAYISWKKAAAEYGYEIDEELFNKTIGANRTRTKEIFLIHFGDNFPFERVMEERIRIAEEIIKVSGVGIKNGLYELLTYLDTIAVKKAVATSTSRQRAESLLKMANIGEYFDYILCGDEIEKSKPDPEIFLKVAHRLNCPSEKSLVLEDSEAGIAAAYKAGMLPIMVPDMKEPDYETRKLIFQRMDNLLEVKSFLEEVLDIESIA